ncbi:hypothetical protein Syun_011833 [Stephania yunnanensis]|uniref:Uncharacterized protein n=1 Tax=Stephania yunnanensis TaxID=152371 RepID=A0AAP0PEQ0_9MAGN
MPYARLGSASASHSPALPRTPESRLLRSLLSGTDGNKMKTLGPGLLVHSLYRELFLGLGLELVELDVTPIPTDSLDSRSLDLSSLISGSASHSRVPTITVSPLWYHIPSPSL